jgi:hypothetical protein
VAFLVSRNSFDTSGQHFSDYLHVQPHQQRSVSTIEAFVKSRLQTGHVICHTPHLNANGGHALWYSPDDLSCGDHDMPSNAIEASFRDPQSPSLLQGIQQCSQSVRRRTLATEFRTAFVDSTTFCFHL